MHHYEPTVDYKKFTASLINKDVKDVDPGKRLLIGNCFNFAADDDGEESSSDDS
jgi:hypothetical protein